MMRATILLPQLGSNTKHIMDKLIRLVLYYGTEKRARRKKVQFHNTQNKEAKIALRSIPPSARGSGGQKRTTILKGG